MSRLQYIFIHFYAFLNRIGIFDIPAAQRLTTRAYFLYKRRYEDPFAPFITKYPKCFANGHIFDVGACLGYHSVLFAKTLSPGFKVYSFEPDRSNFFRLQDALALHRVNDTVIPEHSAVGATTGEIEFWHNDQHFGDHRIATETFQTSHAEKQSIERVQMWSIDEFVRTHAPHSKTAFIKIDVQGFELVVCDGMEQTLSTNPDIVVAIEYSPESLIELGFPPQALLEWFQNREFSLYLLDRKGELTMADDAGIEEAVKRQGYTDLICTRTQILA